MNLGIVTSYIIAGVILISIASMNLRMSSSNAELTITQITREHVRNVTNILNEDLPNMGYNVEEKTDPVLIYANRNKITFLRNIHNDPAIEPSEITWEFSSDLKPPGSRNEHHGTLKRIVKSEGSEPDTTRIQSGVTKFNMYYYDRHGLRKSEHMSPPASGTSLGSVKQIYVELEMQSNEKISGRSANDGRYVRSVWEKRFSPRNLE
jgi:hypothetical protein